MSICECGHPAADHGRRGEDGCQRRVPPNPKGHTYCPCQKFAHPERLVEVWNGETWFTSSRMAAYLMPDGKLIGEPAHFRWRPVRWQV